MGYVGNQQAEGFVQRPTKQDLTGATGTSLTLTHAVSKEEDIDLYINNVKQEPTTAYTVADTAVTLTGSVVASDDIYVVYNSLALQTVTPPDGSVTSAKLASGAAASNLGTSVNLATIKDSTGTNTAITIASDGDLTVGNNLHLTGQPIFSARGRTATFTFSVSGQTGIKFNTIDVNRGTMYSTSTGQVTIPETGIYRLSFTMGNAGSGNNNQYVGLTIYNGTTLLTQGWVRNDGYDHTAHCEVIKELTSGDTITYAYYDSYGTPRSDDHSLTATAVMIA